MFLRSLKLLLWMMLVTGVIYPSMITLFAQLAFPHKANGSMITSNGKTIGSGLIGQKFADEKYFWGRPSASDYNPLGSGGSNLGPISATLKRLVQERKTHYSKSNEEATNIPADLLYASGSGLDPHITVQAALFQEQRVAKARGFDETQSEKLMSLIAEHLEKRQLGFLGVPCVNVLKLNMALDEMKANHE